jgi:hypothetical protein
MTSYNHFRPGSSLSNRRHINKLINYNSNLPFNNLKLNTSDENSDNQCYCFKEKVNKTQQGYNNPSQTNSTRIAHLSINSLGGRTVFGNNYNNLTNYNNMTNYNNLANCNIPAKITYLGGIEGQPGGIPRPLRNRF